MPDVSRLKPSVRSLGALCVLPRSHYAPKEPGEETILMLRRHPITQIPWVFNAAVLIVGTLMFNLFITPSLSVRYGLFANVSVLVFVFAYVWYNFLVWYYNVGFVTTERIIDLDFHGITKRVITEARINKVADVTGTVAGFTGIIFNYGRVFVKTEGPIQNIEFDDVPYPTDVVTIINNLVRS
jgi:hypothetical protein